MDPNERFQPNSMVIYFNIVRGDETLWSLPEEIVSPADFFDTARTVLERFWREHPHVSLLEPGLRLEFSRSPDDEGPTGGI